MGKSSRSSAIKKNNQALKKNVFGPVETARIERQNAKLLALAKAPKELVMEDTKPEDAPAEKETEAAAKETEMDVDEAGKPKRSKREVARLQEARKQRAVAKLRGSRSRPRNQKEFPAHKLKKKAKR
ncbi:hypothetical protein Slin15195_G051140 [Septoria linicola]|uniref:DUF2423 domain-containing protein n=1 Tax=Septoria linicola TaxID=215465 RepID=A0A9Q9EI95_9PEZI|nr:hypothetical protein Slin14017_G129730 [Septoria linicola]USW51795.1 hypothetical protein Slin15195_G051140 [Septoria linicola]